MLLLLFSLFAYAIGIGVSSEIHDIAVTDVTVFPTKVLIIGTVTINVTVENQGTSPETFNVTVYAGTHVVNHPPLTVTDLAPGTTRTLTFQWKLYPIRIMIFPPPWPWPPNAPLIENLTVRAEVTPVAGEVDVSDNIYIDGTVTIIWWVLDVNGDGKIDIKDIAAVAKAFGSSPGNPRWNPMVDFNQDGKIDMQDISVSAKRFGATYI